jgi:hypothetical protein
MALARAESIRTYPVVLVGALSRGGPLFILRLLIVVCVGSRSCDHRLLCLGRPFGVPRLLGLLLRDCLFGGGHDGRCVDGPSVAGAGGGSRCQMCDWRGKAVVVVVVVVAPVAVVAGVVVVVGMLKRGVVCPWNLPDGGM